ncbi:MAG: hypothetical protein EBQ71_04945 [Betaproteobacteria bacterium]|nr:hypothetical protein [Betaproteobacteria bacterium]
MGSLLPGQEGHVAAHNNSTFCPLGLGSIDQGKSQRRALLWLCHRPICSGAKNLGIGSKIATGGPTQFGPLCF